MMSGWVWSAYMLSGFGGHSMSDTNINPNMNMERYLLFEPFCSAELQIQLHDMLKCCAGGTSSVWHVCRHLPEPESILKLNSFVQALLGAKPKAYGMLK